MSRRLRHTLALLASAALLASLTVATVAAPAAAAKPKCQGQTATIVGTAKGEVIVGTAGRDVIVAKGGPDSIYGKGGNDLICAGTGNDLVVGGPGADTVWGQAGNDRLDGGPGPDFLAGQVGNDAINGGLQIDKCYQGTGSGPVVNCELPAPPVVAPTPPPPDSDRDGIPDGSDACPNQGDRGWGVDASGCPNPPLSVTYGPVAAGNWSAHLVWSGTEPGSLLSVRWDYSGSGAFAVIVVNGTGAGVADLNGPCENPGSLVSATLTATEAGGTQQQYPLPLPDSSICP